MALTTKAHMLGVIFLRSIVLINTREIRPREKDVHPIMEKPTVYPEEVVYPNIEDPTVYSIETDELMPTIYFITKTRTLMVKRKHGDILQSCEFIEQKSVYKFSTI